MFRTIATAAVVLAFVWLPSTTETARAQAVRKLAPGVLTVIPPEPKNDETFLGPVPLTNITQLAWDPVYTPKIETLREKASRVVLRHNIWNLEFAFKPLRMVEVDIPQPTGKMQRKLIWYMVYRVRNLGNHLTPVPTPDKTYQPQVVAEALNYGATQPSSTIRFFPHFVLDSRETDKSYLDRVIPVAIPVIERREMRGGKLYSTVEISKQPIPVGAPDAGGGVWGVATWEDVDPRIDFFSISIQGLTNAFRLQSTPQGVVHQTKTLQLNFWRPGDTVYEHEGEIRYGVPAVSDPNEQAAICSKYDITGRVDYLWLYR
jgi:hypothetical protein